MDFIDGDHIYEEEKNKRTSLLISITLHVILLLLCLAPFFNSFVSEEKAFQGILVDIGIPDEGGNDTNKEAQVTDPVEEDQSSSSEEIEEVEPDAPEPVVEKAIPVPIPVESEVSESPDAVIKVDPEADRKAQEAAEEAARKEAAKVAAEKAAAKKAAAEAKKKEYEDTKKKYGDLFGKGQGQDNGGGDQGDPNGDPDASVLEGKSTGLGKIGGGLAARGLVFEPSINDNSQKVGVVVIKVCVNNMGKVISSRFTQKGSTTTDRTLVDVAEKAAAKYQFSGSDMEKQCGTIAIDFKVK